MLKNGDYDYHDEQWVMYRIIKSLCYMPELYGNILNIIIMEKI